ncbi:MAG TPA: hypothetical protein VGY66_20425 [Gemmataceae bacterium]|jgi:DNA-directed RNA polymerase subunit RPC12/RpoP|nr:hypothetical protein [Gemmataceae bacterium]
MAAVIDCPSCQRKLNLPEDLLGRQVRCPTCGHTFTAGLAPESPLPVEVLPEPALPQPRKPAPARLAPGRIGDEPCPSCGRPVPDDAVRCGYCGEYLEDEAGGEPWERPGAVRRDCEPERGGLVITLGIISLVCAVPAFACCFFGPVFGVFGLATGIPAWTIGHKDLRKMREYTMDPAGRSMTGAGMVCGIIGTLLSCLSVVTQVGLLLWRFPLFF